MWPNPQETADFSHLLEKSTMENFIFCAMSNKRNNAFSYFLYKVVWKSLPWKMTNQEIFCPYFNFNEILNETTVLGLAAFWDLTRSKGRCYLDTHKIRFARSCLTHG